MGKTDNIKSIWRLPTRKTEDYESVISWSQNVGNIHCFLRKYSYDRNHEGCKIGPVNHLPYILLERSSTEHGRYLPTGSTGGGTTIFVSVTLMCVCVCVCVCVHMSYVSPVCTSKSPSTQRLNIGFTHVSPSDVYSLLEIREMGKEQHHGKTQKGVRWDEPLGCQSPQDTTSM